MLVPRPWFIAFDRGTPQPFKCRIGDMAVSWLRNMKYRNVQEGFFARKQLEKKDSNFSPFHKAPCIRINRSISTYSTFSYRAFSISYFLFVHGPTRNLISQGLTAQVLSEFRISFPRQDAEAETNPSECCVRQFSPISEMGCREPNFKDQREYLPESTGIGRRAIHWWGICSRDQDRPPGQAEFSAGLSSFMSTLE